MKKLIALLALAGALAGLAKAYPKETEQFVNSGRQLLKDLKEAAKKKK